MKILMRAVFCLLVLSLVYSTVFSQKAEVNDEIALPKAYRPSVMKASTEVQAVLNSAVAETMAAFEAKGFKPEEVAATLIDVRDAGNWKTAEIRGNERIYPASVVKMFFMAALERQIEDGKIRVTTELGRGLRDMIVDSSNEATQYVLDVITGTSSGAEMPEKEFQIWQGRRNRVNRYFSAMGYTNINVNQKTFCEDAYGIEQQSRKYKGENRNMLTTDASARLMAEIVSGRVAGPDATNKMLSLMKRDPFAKAVGDQTQANEFIGKALIDKKMTDARIWSKAGWTSKSRHDAAYVETVDGGKFVLVIFTENHANEMNFIPMVAGKVIDRLKK